MEKKTIIYFRESFIQSVCADVATFGIVLGSLYIGYRFMGGNGWVMFFLWLMAIIAIASKASAKKKEFYDKESLTKYIEETL